jgi:hypothetical protein
MAGAFSLIIIRRSVYTSLPGRGNFLRAACDLVGMDYWQQLNTPFNHGLLALFSNLYGVVSERGTKYGSAFAQHLRPVALFLVSLFGNQSVVLNGCPINLDRRIRT